MKRGFLLLRCMRSTARKGIRSDGFANCTGEDDGYLVLFVHDAATDCSDFLVYDARTMAQRPVAAVKLPQRVPHGFHGKHLNAQQFQSQFPFDIHFLPDI
jgi:carotenoid cleavage dioxygenase